MKKILSLILTFSSISILSSSSNTWTNIASTATTATINAFSSVSMHTKAAFFATISTAVGPLTQFAQDNILLTAATTATIATIAYKAGKYINAPAYKQEDIQEIFIVAKPSSQHQENRNFSRPERKIRN
jgi:hypothetical protein